MIRTIINIILNAFTIYAELLFIVINLTFLIIALLIIANAILYQKCNKPWWTSIIPFYRHFVKSDIAGCHWLIPVGIISEPIVEILHITAFGDLFLCISLFASFCYCYNLSKKFNKGIGFTIGLFLLPIIFIPILAFSKNAIYDNSQKVKNCAFFNVNF